MESTIEGEEEKQERRLSFGYDGCMGIMNDRCIVDVLSMEQGGDEDVDTPFQWLACRTGSMKRKLEELDLGVSEPRLKREVRDITEEAFVNDNILHERDLQGGCVDGDVLHENNIQKEACIGDDIFQEEEEALVDVDILQDEEEACMDDDIFQEEEACVDDDILHESLISNLEEDLMFSLENEIMGECPAITVLPNSKLRYPEKDVQIDTIHIDNTSNKLTDDDGDGGYSRSVYAMGGCSSFRECIDTLASTVNRPFITNTEVHFFVRTFIDGRTIVLHANSYDTIELVHRQIFLKIGIPISEQRLIYFGRQLQHHHTLVECQVCNDATLHLVARMLSTPLHRSWQLMNELVATIHLVTKMNDHGRGSRQKLIHAQEKIRNNVKEFLNLAADSLPISDHMQIFQIAGATSALVILLLSPVESNQECAEDSIKLFVGGGEDCFSTDIHYYCAPVLLDFCKLFSKSAPCHSLYYACRNSLACILDTVLTVHQSIYFNDAKAESIVHDFAPFVSELASKLSLSLCLTSKLYGNVPANELFTNLSLDAKEAHDFTAFIIPLCKAMEACKSVETKQLRHSHLHSLGVLGDRASELLYGVDLNVERGTVDKILDNDGEIGSYSWIFSIFHGLLLEIDNFLGKVEGAVHDLAFGGSPILALLKGLNAIAQMYEGCMENLLAILGLRRTALNMIIQQSGSQNDNFWLLEHTFLLEIESKRKIVLGMLPEPQEDFEERLEFFVRREHLLTDSFHAFENVKADAFQGGLSMQFTTEEAIGPGVLREWFNLICREIFNQENALFLTCANDARRVYPSPASGVNPEHLSYFRFCGQVVALALMHKVQIDVVFASIFLKQVAGLPVSWEDVKDTDPLLYESCKQILEMDADLVDTDALGLTFVHEFEEVGTLKSIDLCLGGADIAVTSKNRLSYVELLVKHQFVTGIEKQTKCFKQGFSDLFVGGSVNQFLQALQPNEFDLLLFGKDRNICVDDWKSCTEYHGYSNSDCHITWFWEVVQSMTMEQRRRLLFFSTSVAFLPMEGFAGLPSKFHIHKAHTDLTWLPTAHTCFFQLLLPSYPSLEIMNSKLYAVIEGHIFEGFGFA